MRKGNLSWYRSRKDRISRLWLFHRYDGLDAIRAVSSAGKSYAGLENSQIAKINAFNALQLDGTLLVQV